MMRLLQRGRSAEKERRREAKMRAGWGEKPKHEGGMWGNYPGSFHPTYSQAPCKSQQYWAGCSAHTPFIRTQPWGRKLSYSGTVTQTLTVVQSPPASASLVNLLETQIFTPHPSPAEFIPVF